MEFPFGDRRDEHRHHHHHHHHHHDGREDQEEERRREVPQYYPPPGHRPDPYGPRGVEEYPPAPAPPPYYGERERGYDAWERDAYPGPPPPAPYHVGHEPGAGYPTVQHVAHEVREEEGEGRRHGHHGGGGPFSFFHHVSHETSAGSGYGTVQHVAHEVREEEGAGRHHGHHGGGGGPFAFVQHVRHETTASGVTSNRRTVRIFTKAAENYSLSIRDGRVILARADHGDEYQHWIKDEKFSTKVKDEEGLPSFALVNKVTGEAIKHSIGATHPVRLVPYNPNYLDESILWTESYDTGEGFRCIRMVNNIRLNFDAFHGDEDHGGVRDGTIVVLWEWLKGKNQRWKIIPY